MKKTISLIIVLLILLILKHSPISAVAGYESGYVISEFSSLINVEKDTGLTVHETVKVDFSNYKHGIYRIIPVYYSHKGKTINARLKVLSITNEKGDKIKYSTRRLTQSLEIKIGDPNITLIGPQTYKIKYKVEGIIQRYDINDEIYWNVTGHEWDTAILKSEAIVTSPNAKIEKGECFAGKFGSDSDFCTYSYSDNNLISETTADLGEGDGFSIVVGLSKDNDLLYPGGIRKASIIILDNWGYIAALFPLFFMGIKWYRKGRDHRYISENIYFEPDDKAKRTVSMFERPHIPFVYHPIAKITPGEAGTIVDEHVHISDIVSEILELARLGFISIKKIETKKLLGRDTDYAFIKTEKYDDPKEREKLKDFQDYLLNELFRSTIIHKSVKNAEDMFKGDEEKLAEVRKLLIDKNYVLLSGIKNHFYEGLPIFKNKLYQRMKDEDIFDGNPEKTRMKWVGIFIAINIVASSIIFWFAGITANYYPLLSQAFFFVPGIFFALSMPRRTPKGYSFYRQIQGLRWYLGKGLWRHEIAEKNLFIEEVLPLAVALGVVDKITKDMSELGIKPPTYFSGSSVGTFSRDLTSFSSNSSSSLLSAPAGKASGTSSWSGGSGFSGGSSGGGFGGGGGGSW